MNDEPRNLCFQLPNLPGTLEPVVSDLANAEVNIESIVAIEGRLAIRVDRPDVLRDVLGRRRIPFSEKPACPSDLPRSVAQFAGSLRDVARRLEALADDIAGREQPIGELPSEADERLSELLAELTALASL